MAQKAEPAKRPDPITPGTAIPTPTVASPVVDQPTPTVEEEKEPTMDEKIDAILDAQREIVKMLGAFPTAEQLRNLSRAGKM